VVGTKISTISPKSVVRRLDADGPRAETNALAVARARLHNRYHQVGKGLARFEYEGDLRSYL